MKHDGLVEAFDRFTKQEVARLETLGSYGVEAATHLRELAEYTYLVDLEGLMQELHHEYINS